MSGDDDLVPVDDPATPPLIPDAADPQQIKRIRLRKKSAERDGAEWWASLLATPVGRREVWTLLAGDCGTFEVRFAQTPIGFPNTEATWHALGKREVGLGLWRNLLRIAPDGVRLMHLENDKG